MHKKILITFVLLLILLTPLFACSVLFNGEQDSSILGSTSDETASYSSPNGVVHGSPQTVVEYGEYVEYEFVAAYIHQYGCLPQNYLTKEKAMELGWVSSEGNLWDVTDKMCIGGDVFGNREGALPDAAGRVWYECDVNYYGSFRGGERIVYSNDGLIYYTSDHYQTFTRLY